MDWIQFYADNTMGSTILFNKGFITTIYAAVSTYILFVLRKKDSAESNQKLFSLPIGTILKVTAVILFFMAGLLEINQQFSHRIPQPHVKFQYILLYTYLFSFILSHLMNRTHKLKVAPGGVYLLVVCLVIYLLSINESYSFHLQVLQNKSLTIHLLAHWTAIITLGLIFLTICRIIRKSFTVSRNIPLITWLLCSWIVIYLSVEVSLATQTIFFNGTGSLHNINQAFIKSGLPILWGLCSFAFMWLGMKFKYRPLRIISLVLFLITLIKLFAFDIRNISAGGKIAAFFCLGVLLLIISFMYQRLKQILIEDADKRVS
jgi:hypothetical protein